MAGPGARGPPRPVADKDVAALKAKTLESGTYRVGSWSHGLVVGLELPRHPQARRGQRRAAPPPAAAVQLLQANASSSPWRKRAARVLKKIEQDFNRSFGAKKRRRSPTCIVLAGSAAVDQAAQTCRLTRSEVHFAPGNRTDASQEITPMSSCFAALVAGAPTVSATMLGPGHGPAGQAAGGEGLIRWTSPLAVADGAHRRAAVLPTSAPAVPRWRVHLDKAGTLTNDFFVNLLDMSTKWKPSVIVGERRPRVAHRSTAAHIKRTYTANDLVFGRTRSFRAPAQVYAEAHNTWGKFVEDFVAAWVKVMNADRFDIK